MNFEAISLDILDKSLQDKWQKSDVDSATALLSASSSMFKTPAGRPMRTAKHQVIYAATKFLASGKITQSALAS